MRSTILSVTFAFVLLGILCTADAARAQGAPQIQPVTHVASLATGSIQGTVQDEKGLPVSGAVVSALGATTQVVVADRGGRFELRMLTPGPYLLRAHQTGFVAPRGQIIDVRPSARASSAISMRHSASSPVLTAGMSTPPAPIADPAPATPVDPNAPTAATNDDHSETAWRLRHARRSILKDVTIPEGLLTEDTPETNRFTPSNFIGRTVASPLASFFTDTAFSGQVNLLTLGSFDTPQQMFSPENFGRSVANLSFGAPVGEHADWTVQAALTQGDIASWILAGEYTTRAPATHRYDVGWSYSMQRYDGGAALRTVAEGSRNAGALYAFDTYSISPELTLTYGGSYAGYDYLEGHGLLSPRVSLTVSPADHLRLSTLISRRALAPGAEEFMPRVDNGVWLPPQRTFSSFGGEQQLQAEYTNHAEVEVERDIAAATVSVRAFRQHVADQLATMFGFDLPGTPAANLGHYLLGNVGDVDATGVSTGIRAAIADRIHGSVEYTVTRARLNVGDDAMYAFVLAPTTVRPTPERIHNVSTSLETDVPETSTRVLVLYRISNGFASPVVGSDRPALDARFDVQVRQSLPFMDFSAAKWEMLVAVRNFFRDSSPDQSVYDELLVVRPPKRIVGGLTLKF
ncbi:MAG TPA: TonB-dependent receptor [Vicinamibacterales bacterium]|nr:TonB-dependent receptor [Vicinamibacterales bacterium]